MSNIFSHKSTIQKIKSEKADQLAQYFGSKLSGIARAIPQEEDLETKVLLRRKYYKEENKLKTIFTLSK